MKPRRPPPLNLPIALTVSLLSAGACAPPTMPGSCVTNFNPPAGATSPSGVRAQIDIAPCSPQWVGPDFFCMTATGCLVEYRDVPRVTGSPATTVSCDAMDQCLWGFTESGQPVLAGCPRVEIQPQQCSNFFDLTNAAMSGYGCSAMQSGCTLGNGDPGQRLSNVTRLVTGSVRSTECPTQCMPFA
jgi:hypothetical protein